MNEALHLIPLDAIDEGALIRDRVVVEEEALGELKGSIAAGGLRMPVEVFALEKPAEGRTHGLISGLRRLAAFRALRAETGEERWTAIPAFVRAPADVAAALAEVVEENEVRADVSAWERGSFVVAACGMGVFATVEEAVDRLYPLANRGVRSRIRAFARVAEELKGHFAAPERLSIEEMMRLAAAIRAGFGEDLSVAVAEAPLADQGAQWAAVLPVLAEAEQAGAQTREGARRVLQLPNGWIVRREKVRGGWLLRISGRDATLAWLEPVFDALERRFLPEPEGRAIGRER